MLKTGGTKRSGFTLPEVLVTVAIVSVLAAIVVPTVTSQIGKGDDTRLATSLTNIRTGITAFVSDTRRFPRRVSQLFNPITATDNDLFGSPYGAAAAARWKGPYATGSVALDDSLPMSLAFMLDSLVDSNLVAGTAGHLIASLSSLSAAQLAHIDSLIDAGNGSALGIMQWPAGDTAKVQLMGSR